MLQYGLAKYDHEEKRTQQWSKKQKSKKFSRIVLIIGILLLLNIGYVSAVNSTDVTTIPPPQTLNITSLPVIQTLNVTSISTLVPDTTLITAVPTAITSEDTTKITRTLRPSAAIDQFTLRAGKLPTQAQKEEAAANYKKTREAYLMQGSLGAYNVMGNTISAAPALDPGGVPHYFGPFANWANSPMPMGHISNITVDAGGIGYTTSVVTIEDVYFTGSGATATATVNPSTGTITSITVTNPGTSYTAPVVIITGAGTGAAATASLGGPFTSGMRKFVDTVPSLNAGGANNLGAYIPVAIPDNTTFPNTDYYEIELGQFTQKMHSDLPATTFRGYRQTNTVDPTVSKFQYLGPLIIAHNGTPVRVKFTNKLPVGAGGNLFLPVDTTVMGAGMGPQGMNVSPIYYTQNRAELHLHGGATPWISDGTPYQWITPAGEFTTYPKGVSVYNVPDMPDPGDGSQTFFYTNQQSARLMFYHDHAHGITRLNVYAGEAAGYLVTDQQETDMITGKIGRAHV